MSGSIPGLGTLGAISPLPKLPSLQPESGAPGFGAVLSTAMQQVNQLATGADQQVGNLLQGRSGDMSTVMIAVEKADVAFQLMMQVRNKIVSAYQDIEKMQF
ncbi:MAG: flagellar hook-basal body complex protein FliE [Acidobacteriaceae bacterium]|jgi:flagellar hook-basal body complex protein FliE